MKDMYIKSYSWKNIKVDMELTSYANWGMAIVLRDKNNKEERGVLSKWICPLPENWMAVDTNNIPNAESFINRYNLGSKVDFVQSWFCTYPIYSMNIKELDKRKSNE